jgi:iron complex outermembrane receptor protein
MPPLKLTSAVSQEFALKQPGFLSAVRMEADLEYNAAQRRFLALYHSETATPGYLLLNLSAGAELNFFNRPRSGSGPRSGGQADRGGHQPVQIQVQVNNVFDAVYQSNLSRLKYFEYYSRTPDGRSGSMGWGGIIVSN